MARIMSGYPFTYGFICETTYQYEYSYYTVRAVLIIPARKPVRVQTVSLRYCTVLQLSTVRRQYSTGICWPPSRPGGRRINYLSEHVAESTHLQVRRVCQGKHLLNDYKQNIENDFNVLNCILVTIARPLLFGFALFLSPLVFRKFADFASTRVFRLHRSFIANLLRSTATSFANAFSILRSHTAAKHSYTVDFI